MSPSREALEIKRSIRSESIFSSFDAPPIDPLHAVKKTAKTQNEKILIMEPPLVSPETLPDRAYRSNCRASYARFHNKLDLLGASALNHFVSK